MMELEIDTDAVIRVLYGCEEACESLKVQYDQLKIVNGEVSSVYKAGDDSEVIKGNFSEICDSVSKLISRIENCNKVIKEFVQKIDTIENG